MLPETGHEGGHPARVLDVPGAEGFAQDALLRGDLLRKLGRSEEAATEFERAASLTENAVERTLLHKRAAECTAERMAG